MRVFTRIVVVCALVTATLLAVPVTTNASPETTDIEWLTTSCGQQPNTISELGKEFIRHHETLTLEPYFDTTGYAIGYGMHTWQGRKVQKAWPRHVTARSVEDEFNRQLATHAAHVRTTVCVTLSQAMMDALVSLSWNVGRVNTAIIRKVDAKRPIRVADFLTTTRAGHARPVHLIERRVREYLMFTGNYTLAMQRPVQLNVLQEQARQTHVVLSD